MVVSYYKVRKILDRMFRKALELGFRPDEIEVGITWLELYKNKDGKRVGRVLLYLIFNYLHPEPYVLLEDVYVEEEHRGQGIGKYLAEKANEIAEASGCYKSVATARDSRPHVQRMYEKIGMKRWGTEFRKDF